jgi:integrase
VLRPLFARAFAAAETTGWSVLSLQRVLAGLEQAVKARPDRQPIPVSELRVLLGATRGIRLDRVTRVLQEEGLLVEDTVPTMRSWIEQRCAELPAGFGDDVRAWLLVLLDGDARARPRATSTIYGYFGRIRPHLITWSATRGQLREVTAEDVRAALDPLRGHRLAGTFVAVRSLFRFAHRHRLVFADPTRRLHIGHVAPVRELLPMSDTQIAAVAETAVTPAQRLVVALAAVHAARAAAIRALTLDDIDLAARRITLAGHPQRLGELVHQALHAWLQHRHATWPHTPNRHVLISAVTATGTTPVSDYYLSWHLLLRGVALEQIRGDHVLHEALAVRADPLHLAAVFQLSTATAIAYANIARALLERPVETPSAEL